MMVILVIFFFYIYKWPSNNVLQCLLYNLQNFKIISNIALCIKLQHLNVLKLHLKLSKYTSLLEKIVSSNSLLK